MLNPGIYSLGDQVITIAVTGLVLNPVVDLDGLTAVTLQVRFAPVSGGTTCKAWVQTSLDQGQTWADIFCAAFTTTAGFEIINLSGLTPRTTVLAPTDATLADDTAVDGVLGAAPEDHLDRHIRVRFGDLRQGGVPMTPERIAAMIAQFGQPVTLQRLTGTATQVRHDVVCLAMVRGYEPVQLIGGIILGDRQVAISNAEIADAQWPGPPRANDRCVIDGRITTIQACDTRKLRDDIVLHLIQVRG